MPGKYQNEDYGSMSESGSDSYISNVRTKKESTKPSLLVVHGALLFTYVMLGGGCFASRFGVNAESPLFFEMVREVIAGPIMSLVATLLGGPMLPDRSDFWRTTTTVLMFIGNQVCFMIGLKLTEPVFAGVWQIAIPIITTVVAVMLGYENTTTLKTVGIVTACGGAIAMNVLQVKFSHHVKEDSSSMLYVLAGHACFLLQAVSSAGYILIGKPLLKKYPPLSVTGWSFTFGSVFMTFLTILGYKIPALHSFMCWSPNKESMKLCMKTSWTLPTSMIVPLIYEIVGCSFIAWFLITWANKHANASTVTIYAVTQPLAAALISALAIMIKGGTWAKWYAIEMPGVHHLIGVLIISAGLYVLYRDSKSRPKLNIQGQKAQKAEEQA